MSLNDKLTFKQLAIQQALSGAIQGPTDARIGNMAARAKQGAALAVERQQRYTENKRARNLLALDEGISNAIATSNLAMGPLAANKANKGAHDESQFFLDLPFSHSLTVANFRFLVREGISPLDILGVFTALGTALVLSEKEMQRVGKSKLDEVKNNPASTLGMRLEAEERYAAGRKKLEAIKLKPDEHAALVQWCAAAMERLSAIRQAHGESAWMEPGVVFPDDPEKGREGWAFPEHYTDTTRRAIDCCVSFSQFIRGKREGMYVGGKPATAWSVFLHEASPEFRARIKEVLGGMQTPEQGMRETGMFKMTKIILGFMLSVEARGKHVNEVFYDAIKDRFEYMVFRHWCDSIASIPESALRLSACNTSFTRSLTETAEDHKVHICDPERERHLMKRLALYSGYATGDALESLSDREMLRVHPDGVKAFVKATGERSAMMPNLKCRVSVEAYEGMLEALPNPNGPAMYAAGSHAETVMVTHDWLEALGGVKEDKESVRGFAPVSCFNFTVSGYNLVVMVTCDPEDDYIAKDVMVFLRRPQINADHYMRTHGISVPVLKKEEVDIEPEVTAAAEDIYPPTWVVYGLTESKERGGFESDYANMSEQERADLLNDVNGARTKSNLRVALTSWDSLLNHSVPLVRYVVQQTKAALIAIELKVAEPHKEEKDVRVNARRVASGKKPLPVCTTIQLCRKYEQSASRAKTKDDGTPSRESPRLHFRRKHSRTLPTGKVIEIPRLLVGDPTKGWMPHKYKV